jgi:acetyl-CoA carboxylase biotin carboxylase subunit
MPQLRRVLIANRGEIAVRIARGCRENGIETVAVFSEADTLAPHVVAADAAVCIGQPPSTQSYLNVERILAAARATGADAVHPGYGFLSENAAFARAVEDAGMIFIGPRPESIAAMGDKPAARKTARAAGVPVAEACEEPPTGRAALAAAADRIGYPLLVKAAAGGGGKGMRIVREKSDLVDAFETAAREATAAFGDGRLFLERYLERSRHVEVQVLADAHGNMIHLGERECSIQRRHQKLVEESPSPVVDPSLRNKMTEAALSVARKVAYRSAGTVEFLLDESGNFFFLEMNTRLQVEHPVTELVTGIDLVQAQLRIADGEILWLRQEDVVQRGHAIECRICAEDPARGFLPSPGRILTLEEPAGPGLRIDSGIRAGFEVSMYYDPLLAKICSFGSDREEARRRMVSALNNYVILGCTTGITFLRDLLQYEAFVRGETHTHFIDQHFASWRPRAVDADLAAIAAAILSMQHLHTGTATVSADQSVSSPWMTLGNWRLGQGPN